MTKPLGFTRAGICRAIAAAEAAGMRVVGIRADGTVIVDRGNTPHPLVPVDTDNADASKWSDVEA